MLMVLLGVTPWQSVAVVVSAVALYVLLLLLVRIGRGRILARLTAADAALLLVLGSVIGRGVLGSSPTLAAAALAVGVLVVLRIVTGLVARTGRGRGWVDPVPLLLIGGGRIVVAHLRRARIRPDELLAALRVAGVSGMQEVACAVLESNGAISVTRYDPEVLLDRQLFRSVRGIEQVPDHYFRPAPP